MTTTETTMTKATATPGTETREGFGTTTMTRSAETASTAVAAAATAAIQARYIMAMQRPRDLDTTRLAILKECRRPAFAAVARYRKPIGEGVEGPSIRFAEVAVRCMGNVDANVATIYDDPEKRILHVSVTDLESNTSFGSDITVVKTVERSKPRDGVPPISVRTNSVGVKTYTVEATEDDLGAKQGALVSKALRDHALRLVPGDIKDEAMAEVIATLAKEDAQDPAAARKKLIDGFDALGVKPSSLREYLGHDLDASTPAEISELRAVWNTLKEGEAKWIDVLAHKLKTSREAAEAAGATVKETTLKEKVKAAAKGHDPQTGEVK